MNFKSSGGEFETLKSELESLGKRLSNFSHDALKEGKAETKEVGNNALHYLNDEMRLMRKNLEEVTETVKGRAKAVDKNVHENPYVYMASAAGAGYLLGKFLQRH